MTRATGAAVEAVWRTEQTRLIAGLARVVQDVGLAEDLAQDALVAALETWPQRGVPDKPGAWLMTTARHRGLDLLRRRAVLERKQAELGRDLQLAHRLAATQADLTAEIDVIDDDVLRLVFTACSPVLSTEAQVALTLRLVGGLTTEEIARAFLVGEATVAQRIVRAKRTLAAAGEPLEVPEAAERPERISAVLRVIYLIFNEGYCATSGDDWMRPALCADAQRMVRVLAALLPAEPEVAGLEALVELQASRMAARQDAHGEPALLLDQDRNRWDWVFVTRGLAALERAERLAESPGAYALQAAIAACHARARVAEDTDWTRIAALYAALARRTPSPVIELNRAMALSMALGPEAGLEVVERLLDEPALKDYHLLPAVHGDLLAKLGRHAEARDALTRAATLTSNERERRVLRERAETLE